MSAFGMENTFGSRIFVILQKFCTMRIYIHNMGRMLLVLPIWNSGNNLTAELGWVGLDWTGPDRAGRKTM